VFHTNVHNERLAEVRNDFRARRNVKKYMNSANFTAEFPHGVYYGKPSGHAWHKRVRIALGSSAIGPMWRTIKETIGIRGTAC
jgi:hypothetical protein